jgi:hypothetical protein
MWQRPRRRGLVAVRGNGVPSLWKSRRRKISFSSKEEEEDISLSLKEEGRDILLERGEGRSPSPQRRKRRRYSSP